jgi:hypothetical protein
MADQGAARMRMIGFLGSSTSKGYANVVRLIWGAKGYQDGINVTAECR